MSSRLVLQPASGRPPGSFGGKKSARTGFTLVEILVACAVFSLIVLLLVSMASGVSAQWSSGIGRVEKRQNARALGDAIANELGTALLPVNRLDNTNPNLQFILNPAQIAAGKRHPSALFWQSPLAPATDQGDILALGYFVRWDTSSATPRAMLCRLSVSSGDTNNFLVYSQEDWINDSLLDNLASGTVSADPSLSYRGLFAENVIGFWVRCLDVSGAEVAGASGTLDSRGASPMRLPSSVEISMALLDSRSSQRLTGPLKTSIEALAGSSSNAAHFATQAASDAAFAPIRQGLSTYTTRVHLENSQ